MEWLWLVVGILIGAGVAWFWLEKKLAERQAAVEAHYEGRLHHLQEEVGRADQAHEETKVTLRDLLAERNAGNDRIGAADAATAAARREADAAQRERDRLQREHAAAQAEIERLRGRPAANAEPPHDLPLVVATPPAPPAPIDPTTQRLRAIDARMKMLPAGSSARANLLAERNRLLSGRDGAASAEPTIMPQAPADQAPDNLEVIKGIGPRIHRELETMGIVTFAQLAALSSEQIAFIEEKTGFPGRVGRERWVDQARELMSR